jgi:hypothetical protein
MDGIAALDASAYRTRTPAQDSPGSPNWRGWPAVQKALSQTYCREEFSQDEQRYALACCARFAFEWNLRHEARGIPLVILDEAAANEVWYHWLRSTQFRRPCAALGMCWLNLVTERPERILDRYARAMKKAAPIGAARNER